MTHRQELQEAALAESILEAVGPQTFGTWTNHYDPNCQGDLPPHFSMDPAFCVLLSSFKEVKSS